VLPDIQVLQVRDGLIVETRACHHDAALVEMMS
jgi:hypothetical protein